jgi:hypothetical protein
MLSPSFTRTCYFIIFWTRYIAVQTPYSWSWALLEKPPIVQLLKNFPVFYGTPRFITVFTRALHWSITWARPSNTYHPFLSLYNSAHLPNIFYKFRFIIILPYLPRLINLHRNILQIKETALCILLLKWSRNYVNWTVNTQNEGYFPDGDKTDVVVSLTRLL